MGRNCFALVILVSAVAAQAQQTVPALGVITLRDGATGGEIAARDLAARAFSAREIAPGPDGGLALPADLKVLWWHCEHWPFPVAMTDSRVKRALVDWVAAGHGLFLSGTALAYVQALGLEPASPRATGSGGVDTTVAGVGPGDTPGHPVFAGFPPGQPVFLCSGGYPPFADFWGSGGPKGGVPIGEAAPNAGETPCAEYACGAGRVIVLGWRLPHYGLAGNAYRDNLERFTGNVLRYLGGGKWFRQIADSRLRGLRARLDRVNTDAFRRAVTDLTATFPERYTRGKEYLALLDRLPALKDALERGDVSAGDEAEKLLRQLDEALLANPLLDFDELLLIARSEANLGLPQNWDSNSSIASTGYNNELAVLSPVGPDGKLTTVLRPSGGRFIGDVRLASGGDRVLFSMPGDNGRWQVYEMDLTTREPKQLPLIEAGDIDNYDACYLPDGNIIFTSTAPFVGVPCVTGSSHVSNMYRLDRATGRIRRLTFEQDHDWCPTMLPDGRVLYLRWEYSDIPHFVSRILFTMNPDGTGQSAFYGSNSYWPNAMFYARPIPASVTKFVAIVGGHHDNPRMGELVLFDAAKGRTEADGAIQRIPGYGKKIIPVILDGLTLASWPKFLHPYPLSDKYFLVSCKPTPSSNWGIYLVDVFDNMTLVKESDSHALLEPIPLRPTAPPPVIASKVDLSRKDALVLMTDIYQGQGLAGVPRGTIKKLRLFTYHFAYHNMGGQVNRVGIDGPWDIKRIVGTVPVKPDGSAFFRIPANTPISVQPLDERGQALQLMRSWMTAMPGETLSCVGCHEQRNSVTPARPKAAALNCPPEEITPWYGPTRGFSFAREVQPVLDHYCISCHNGSGPKGLDDFRSAPMVHPPGPDNGYKQGSLFTPSYLALKRYVRNATIESDMHLLTPGEFAADTTWLMQLLRKGHYGAHLDDEAWDRLTTWIDLNTPAHGTWHEIVGEGLVNHQRDRRRETLRQYAGIDEDPEAIIPASYRPVGPAPVGLLPEPARPVTCPGWPFSAEEAKRRQLVGGKPERTVDLGDGLALKLIRVPAGEMVMGDPNGFADERPQARVKITRPFFMGQFEVTNEQFRRFLPDHDSRQEEGDFLQFSVQERGYTVNDPEQPVERVSWREAMAFCEWLSKRTGLHVTLPTEGQWEWACRAGTDTAMWYGPPDTNFARFANLADICLKRVDTFPPWDLPSGAIAPWRPAVDTVDDGYRVASPVGTYLPNRWGLYDMAGNAAEWTRSDYFAYPYQPGLDVVGGSGEKVVRGGSWYDTPMRARSGFRQAYPPYRKVFNVGFRVIVEMS